MAVTRRFLREKAMQILYAFELTKDPIEQIKRLQLTDIEKEEDLNFINNIVDYTILNGHSYEDIIKETVDNWDMERIALVDSIIIKMCITEFMFIEDIPTKVSINEAIDIAKEFSTKNSGKFVNGVLDAILIKLKERNKINKKGKGLINEKKSALS